MNSSANRPRIAISCDFEEKPHPSGVVDGRFWLSETYVTALDAAGALSYLLPPILKMRAEIAQALLQPMDGLIISGGAFDVDPQRYGQKKHPLCGPLRQNRTNTEAHLLDAAHRLGMPCLGICGGMQLMVVQHGGTLFQDTQLRPNTDIHEQKSHKSKPSHTVTLKEGSLLHACYNSSAPHILEVNSTHHQLVDDVGQLEAIAHSPDGVIEAVQKLGSPFYLGVQWHPEALAPTLGLPIYKAFVDAANEHRLRGNLAR